MRRVKFSFFLSLLFFSNFTFAAQGSANDAYFTLNDLNLTYNGPMDTIEVGTADIITSQTGTTVSACTNAARAYIKPESPGKITGNTITIGEVTYPIFQSNVQGIGWFLGVRLKDNPTTYTPLEENNQLFINTTSNGYRAVDYNFGWVRYPFLNLQSGTYTLSPGTVAIITCFPLNSNTVNGTSAFTTTSKPTITVTTKSCDIDNASKTGLSMMIPEVNWVDLNRTDINSGYTDVYGQTSITITCQAGVDPKFSVNRRKVPSISNSTLIGIDHSSQNPGFDLQLRHSTPNGSPLVADGTVLYSFRPTGNSNASQVTTAGEIRTLDLFATFYKSSNTIELGTFSALVDINVYYQ